MAHPQSQESPGVEFQALLIDVLAAQVLHGVPVQRRLEARGVHVDGAPAKLRAALDALLHAVLLAPDPREATEVSLVGYSLADTNARAPSLRAGDWLRLGLRRRWDAAAAQGAFDRPGLPFAGEAEAALRELGGSCTHHRWNQHLLIQLHLPALGLLHRREPLHRPARILFVDDEVLILEVHRQSIESLGYDVIECADPRSALDLFREHPDAFDVVLSDQTMPGMSGDQLARQLMAIRPSIPVVLSTGLATAGTRSLAASANVLEILDKPFTMEELAQCLARVT